MVNLIKVKRTSIAVAVALIILFPVRISLQVNKEKYVRPHTQRHYQDGCIYYQEALDPPSNYEEGIIPQKLSRHMYRLSSQT